jgi:hypothetical protein
LRRKAAECRQRGRVSFALRPDGHVGIGLALTYLRERGFRAYVNVDRIVAVTTADVSRAA